MTRRWTSREVSRVRAAPGVSRSARNACASFGLIADPTRRPGSPMLDHTERLASGVRGAHDASVILITGPSGSGKTTLLGALRGGCSAVADGVEIDPDVAAFDLVAGARPSQPQANAEDDVRSALSSAGLAEPALWVRPYRELSAGESARLRLACAMIAARPGDRVLCDEFGSNLDRVSAASLARTASRWARRSGVALIAAAAHEDMPRLLSPDLIADTHAGTLERPAYAMDTGDPVRVEAGDIADFRSLERYHYLGARPATIRQILRAVRSTPFGDVLAGVLVVSNPVFNGVWRRQAWPGRYDGVAKKVAAARMNRELRCISRVIVEPRSRGLGVASMLVRAYLAQPLTGRTEAVAAMGGVSPFFRAAGMVEYHLPRPAFDARLCDALGHAGIDTHSLLDESTQRDAFIARELTRWAKHARIRIEDENPLPAIARHAVCRLASRPRAYAAGGSDGDGAHT